MYLKKSRWVSVYFRTFYCHKIKYLNLSIQNSVASISVSGDAARCATCLGKDPKNCLLRHQCISNKEIPSVMVPGNLTDIEIHKYLTPMNDTKLWILDIKGFTGSSIS